jgi:predicted RNase H-like HicB family nuclease
MSEYTILLAWDDEAHVWVAESDDIPGLILESGSLDALIERAKVAAPELLEISGGVHTNIHLLFKMERMAVVAREAVVA